MEEIMNRARVMDNELGDEIRDLDKRGVRIFGRIVVKLLQVNHYRIFVCSIKISNIIKQYILDNVSHITKYSLSITLT